MRSRPETFLLQRFCRAPDCRAMFICCDSCNRGQVYCGESCRAPARHQQRRAANQRYQQSRRGRITHSRRQDAYRKRKAAARSKSLYENKVTDHSSNAQLLMRPSRPRDLSYWANAIFLALLRVFCPRNGFSACQFCGRRGKFFIRG